MLGLKRVNSINTETLKQLGYTQSLYLRATDDDLPMKSDEIL